MSELPSSRPTDILAPRDRLQRLRTITLTPAERLTRMRQLIEVSWGLLEKNPAGVAHFRQRNFRARAIRRREGSAAYGP